MLLSARCQLVAATPEMTAKRLLTVVYSITTALLAGASAADFLGGPVYTCVVIPLCCGSVLIRQSKAKQSKAKEVFDEGVQLGGNAVTVNRHGFTLGQGESPNLSFASPNLWL